MKYVIVSDIHFRPDMAQSEQNKMRKFIEIAESFERIGYNIVLAGDIFNVLDWGRERVYNDPFCAEMLHWASQQSYLQGNHDAQGYTDHIIDNGWYICHGHQWDYQIKLLGWFPLSTKWIPDCVRRWWDTPNKEKLKGRLENFHLLSMSVEYGAQKFMVQHGYHGMVIGHTHCSVIINREGFTLASGGALWDGDTYVLLDTVKNTVLINHVEN